MERWHGNWHASAGASLDAAAQKSITDWVLALVGAYCAAYLFIFYRELATRPGQPTPMDVWRAMHSSKSTVPVASSLSFLFHSGSCMSDVSAVRGREVEKL